jgi:hypothetical protein
MTLIWQFIELLVVHWIGDFVFQSHWMGVNKSKRSDVLALHIAIYTATLMLGTALIFLPSPTSWFVFALVNGALHFCTDFVTSRITSRLYAAKEYHYFFVVIGFDQLIHQATLALTLYILVS